MSDNEPIPFDKLGIPVPLRKNLEPTAPAKVKIAVAKGLLPTTADVQLAVCYVLTTDPDAKVSEAAKKTMAEMPFKTLQGAINLNTHPKIIEFIADFCTPSNELDELLLFHRRCNDRTALVIAARADEKMCEILSNHHQRLLMTPDVFTVLYGNEKCSDATIEKMRSFMQLHDTVPMVPSRRPFQKEEARPQAARGALTKDLDLFADDQDDPLAALHAAATPTVERALDRSVQGQDKAFHTAVDKAFSFDFEDELAEFGWDLIQERERKSGETDDEEVNKPLEQRISEMNIGKKIKLAYLGNAECRKILVRDRNKIVAAAVLKSGKCSEPELVSFAGNRNLDAAVAREISRNPEWTRKYPIRLALARNNKAPVPVTMPFLSGFSKKDLKSLSLDRNAHPAIVKLAKTMVKGRS